MVQLVSRATTVILTGTLWEMIANERVGTERPSHPSAAIDEVVAETLAEFLPLRGKLTTAKRVRDAPLHRATRWR